MTRLPILKALLAVVAMLTAGPAMGAAPAVLVYQRNGPGFVHDNLAASAQALREIGKELEATVEVSTNASVFTDENLRKYRAVIFANSNNDAFEDDRQRASFRRYIEAGGGFVGIHSSTGSERHWDWFQQTQGGRFLRHAPMQTFGVRVTDARHPATAHFPAGWRWTDECYFFTNLNPGIHVLLVADTAGLRDPKLASEPGQKAGGGFPLAWCIESQGSRRFYTALGHKIAHYSDEPFRRHLRGGIAWVLGLAGESGSPPIQP